MVVRTLSLFAGVGALDLAVGLVFPEARTVCYVENEVTAIRVLAARMEDGSLEPAPVWSDIHTFDGAAFRGLVDVVHGGIPCQPYSLAGQRQGNEDERALWPEFARVVGECRPSLVFIENVPAFVTAGGFRPLGEELCRLGYEIEDPVFLAAGDVGAPHRRERVFILAHTVRIPGRERARRERVLEISEGDGGAVAHTPDDHGRSGECGTEAGAGETGERGGRSPVSEREVEHPGSEGPQGAGSRPPGRDDVDGCDETVADPEGHRRREREPQRGEEGREAVGGASGDMADAECIQLRDKPGRCSGEGGAGEAEPGDDVPWLFPPGPGEHERWAGVPEWLAPAVEPGVRCVVDESAVVVDAARADQLRAAGNAVVVLQAAVALRELVRRLGGEAHGKAQAEDEEG